MFFITLVFFVVLFILLWTFDVYVYADFVLPFLFYLHFYDFSLCTFLILGSFTFLCVLGCLNLVYVLVYFSFNFINSVVSLFSMTYLFLSNRFFFSFMTTYVCLYRFLFYDLYFLFLFYFLFVFINVFGFLISDIFMFFIFLDFFGLFIDLLCFDLSYFTLHTLPLPCF